MPNTIEAPRKHEEKQTKVDYGDATTSAVGSIAEHFLRENKERGGTLYDVSRGIVIYPDGTSKKVKRAKED